MPKSWYANIQGNRAANVISVQSVENASNMLANLTITMVYTIPIQMKRSVVVICATFKLILVLQVIRHKRRYHNKHEEVCEKCGKKCKSRHALNKHIASVHTVHKCPSCSEEFSTSAKMRKHSNEVHGIDIPWNMLCSKCPRSFPTKRELSKHILSKHPD